MVFHFVIGVRPDAVGEVTVGGEQVVFLGLLCRRLPTGVLSAAPGRKMAANQTCCDVSLVLASSALRCLRIRDRALRVEWTALFGCLVSRFRIRVTAVWSLAAAAFAVCHRRTALHGRRQGRMPRLLCGSLGKYRCCLRGGRVSAAHAAAVAIGRELVFARKADQGCACRAAQFEGERTWR